MAVKVKCVDNCGMEHVLGLGQVYDAEPHVSPGSLTASSYLIDGYRYVANRFVVVSDEQHTTSTKQSQSKEPIDVEESRLRATLTSISDPFTCKKCGAPLATCERNNYH